MESRLTLPVAQPARAKVLQITDTHLFAGKHQTLLGINTYESYHAVLDALSEAIASGAAAYDVVLATGDLVQDHSSAAYHHFAEGIKRLALPCFWLPGNHDFQPTMVDTLAAAGISSAKQILLGEYWQLILLDSQVSGVEYGEISEQQLAWLEQCLQAYPERYTLLSLHHHPIPCGCRWLDQHGLRNAPALAMLLARYPRVNTLLCGHIHQEWDVNWQRRRLLSTPSTCVQFTPNSSRFALDALSPGWRSFELMPEGELHTWISRLAGNRFLPDANAEGY